MSKQKLEHQITVSVVLDEEYANSNHLQELKNEIEILIASYNCFLQTSEVMVH